MTTPEHSTQAAASWEDTVTMIGEPDVLTDEERDLRKLPMKDIGVRPDYFQPRQFLDNAAESEKAIEEFTRVIQSGGRLPPISVMKIGGRWYVIDGHHRLDAYGAVARARKVALRKSGKRGKELTHIPVTVFEGTIQQARDESVRKNCHDHVNMSRSDKMQEAWQRVAEGQHTTKEIWQLSSISVRMVYYMRVILAKARTLQPEVNFATGWKWVEVLRLVHGLEPKTDQESLDQQWVESKSRHFQKTFGADARKKTRLFARVIRKGDAPLSVTLGQELVALDRQADQDEATAARVEREAELGG
ncbi:MAG: ParB N-terminal domain-containing protein [Nitrospiraceae bacterium]|nr:ParB N-terminal domain-containing protein [Nitrospiraceae bacterium]